MVKNQLTYRNVNASLAFRVREQLLEPTTSGLDTVNVEVLVVCRSACHEEGTEHWSVCPLQEAMAGVKHTFII